MEFPEVGATVTQINELERKLTGGGGGGAATCQSGELGCCFAHLLVGKKFVRFCVV